MLRKIIKVIFCKIFFRVKYVNSNLEKNIERCVVCANHSSWLDPLFLYADSDSLNVMAKAELFKFKPFGYILKKVGVFPINRGQKDVKSIMHAVNLFKEGKSKKLLIFPEGTRIKNDKRIPGKIGAAYVAMKADIPVLPTRIIYEKRGKLFSKVFVVYGDPITLNKENIKDKDYLRKSTDEILDKIYNIEKPDSFSYQKKSSKKKEKIKIEK